jgi:hypothetical protein
MAECDWAILCDYAFLDAGRKQCIIGAFDRIYTARVPTALPKASVAVKVIGNPSEQIRFRFQIIRPTGIELLHVDGQIAAADTGSADIQFNLVNTTLPDIGVYSINVYLNDELARPITFQVVEQPSPQSTAPDV